MTDLALATLTLGQAASGYRPFLDPLALPMLDLQEAWWLTLIPLALLISLAYKAIRVDDLSGIVRHTLIMAAQIVLAMIGLGVGMYLFVELIVPRIGS